MQIEPIKYNHKVGELLLNAALPVDDLAANSKVRLFAATDGAELFGLVGIEGQGEALLLRSLVFNETARQSGLGRALVSYAETQACDRRANTLYLLTTTAELFFSKLGYSPVARNDAHEAITATAQFSSLCPDSAVFMFKHLDH